MTPVPATTSPSRAGRFASFTWLVREGNSPRLLCDELQQDTIRSVFYIQCRPRMPTKLVADRLRQDHSTSGGYLGLDHAIILQAKGQTPALASMSLTRSPRLRALALLSWPQAAKISRPRGVRMGALRPPSFTISAKRCMRLLELHS